LQFKTIAEEHGMSSESDYSGTSPDFAIVAQSDQIESHQLGVVLPDDIQARLSQLSFTDGFTIMVFRGRIGGINPAYAISVTEITHQGGVIDIFAVTGDKEPGDTSLMAFSSPYHIVHVQSDEDWRKWALVRLIVNGAAVKWRLAWLP